MKRILVIDDDVQMRQMLKQMLERQGYEVVVAADGKEGMMLYRQEATDLIITDIIMPNKEGVETIIELRHDFPDVKIIAMSGGSRALDAQDCLTYVKCLGASCVFSKPFERMELLEAIQGLLGNVHCLLE
jgi:CheY-like chemotaxis protein